VPFEVIVEFDDALPADERVVVDVSAVETLVARVLVDEAVEDDTVVTVLFADDAFLQALNREHRDIDEPTDVLSYAADAEGEDAEAFPGTPADEDEPPYLGDIAVSVPTALRQAAAANLESAEEIAHLVVHGLLHILGYDHEELAEDAAMRAREEGYLGPRIHAAGPDAHVLHR
jgi:probable rRNA maturation factor